MSLFGKKDTGKTVLILDVENGSVGSTLARVSRGQAPRLFGESRIMVPVMDTRSALQLARAVEHAASESILHASEVSARLRNHRATSNLGEVEKVIVFLAAPWGVPNLEAGRPDFSEVLTEALKPRMRSLFEDVPIALHAHASSAIHGLRMLHPDKKDALLFSVNGELSELLLLEDGRVTAHATAPVGINTLLRTLQSHAGLSEHEARSALQLATHSGQGLGRHTEALDAAAEHFVGEFKEAARDLLAGRGGGDVFVLAPDPTETWVAKSLAHRSLAELFPAGGAVRALRSSHVAPFVSSQSPRSDVHLLLDALYVNASEAKP